LLSRVEVCQGVFVKHLAELVGHDHRATRLVSNQSSPNNVNNQTQYTSSSQFSVGLEAGTDGLTRSTSYNIGSSETQTINDWYIEQLTPNEWLFAQQQPFDGTTKTWHSPDQSFPAISRSTLAFNAVTVWVQTPASDAQLQSSLEYVFGGQFLYATTNSGTCWNWDWVIRAGFFVNFQRAFPSNLRSGT